jgi:hypothetical protein
MELHTVQSANWLNSPPPNSTAPKRASHVAIALRIPELSGYNEESKLVIRLSHALDPGNQTRVHWHPGRVVLE